MSQALKLAIGLARDFIEEYARTYPECASRGCTGIPCRPCAAKRALAALCQADEGASTVLPASTPEAVERVAEAIFDHLTCRWWDEAPELTKERVRSAARAALAALRGDP